MSWKDQLERELSDVHFSQNEKMQLSADLKSAADSVHLKRSFSDKLRVFWHGSTEIPIPAAGLGLCLVGLGVWVLYSSILGVDQSAAYALLQVGSESIRSISQGVSVI